MPQVIGTAGHVDHGKSALIQALTGIDPDRLAEEKARGLTIDLGFAWTTLPSGREVGFVDVPGHERFVHNMLAGVGGIGCALFVVDAWKLVTSSTGRESPVIGIPLPVLYLVAVVGFALTTVRAGWEAVRLRPGPPAPPDAAPEDPAPGDPAPGDPAMGDPAMGGRG